MVRVVVWGPPRTPQGIRNNFGEFFFGLIAPFLDPKRGVDDAPGVPRSHVRAQGENWAPLEGFSRPYSANFVKPTKHGQILRWFSILL